MKVHTQRVRDSDICHGQIVPFKALEGSLHRRMQIRVGTGESAERIDHLLESVCERVTVRVSESVCERVTVIVSDSV